MFSSLMPNSSAISLPPVRIAMSSSIALRRSPKPGALTATQCSVPRILLTTRVARASPSISSAMMTKGLPDLAICSRIGRDFFHVADLLFVNQQVSVLEHAFHSLRVRDEVGRKITAIKLHAFDDIQRGFQALGFFNGDHAFFADFVHRLGNDIADGGVVVRGDGADLGDFFGVLGRSWTDF